MPHPFREHVERYGFIDGVDAVAMAESLRAFLRAVCDLGGIHHVHDLPPCRRTAPRPERFRFLPLPLLLADGMHHVQEVKRGVRDRHGPEDAAFPFFQRLERHSLPGKIYPLRRDGQGFGNTAPGIVQERAERAHLTRETLRGHQKRGALSGGEIEPLAVAVMQTGQGRGRAFFGVCNRTHKGSVAKLTAPRKRKREKSGKNGRGQGGRATELPIPLQRMAGKWPSHSITDRKIYFS